MKIVLAKQAKTDIRFWNCTDPAITEKIIHLLETIAQTPYTGIGKPEPLKHALSGCCSQPIDREHRLVYMMREVDSTIVSCSYHYSK